MDGLPSIYQPRKSSFSLFLVSLMTLFIMLVAVPVGVYLVGKQSLFFSKAASVPAIKDSAVLSLEKGDLGKNGKYLVNLKFKSSTPSANLIITKINFPADSLMVQNIATSSAHKWVENSIDNEKGEINLIVGASNPGFTDPNENIATIVFQPKKPGLANLTISSLSQIYNNQTNLPMAFKIDNLALNLADIPVVSPPRVASSTPPKIDPKQTPQLTLTTPKGGEVFSFNQPLLISWEESNLTNFNVLLFLNNQLLGNVASVSASAKQLSLDPQQYILPQFINGSNAFSVRLESLDGKISTESAIPFGFSFNDQNVGASQSANLAKRGGDGNKDGVINWQDLSILLSSYNSQRTIDLGVDLNGDGVVSDIDFYFLKEKLLQPPL